MDGDRSKLLKRALEYTLSLDQAERAEYLERVATGQPDIIDELRLLVRGADGSADDLDQTLSISDDQIGAGPDSPAQGKEFTGPKKIAGYRIERELGAGGMGTVFEAHDLKMKRQVALKVLARHLAPSARAGVRFEKEAWIAGRLNHPNLVKVYEYGTWEDLSYYSMELMRGGSLGDVVSNMKRWGRDDRLDLEFGSSEYIHWVIRTMVEICRALDHAHREGVVHRDIKPVNLLLSRETGAVKIADFGLALQTDVTRMTTEGKAMGTLGFMAPEQILGKRDQIGPRTDIYALGATLFQLLTLELPFRGETQEMYFNAVLTHEARRPSKINENVGRDLEIVIRKALEKSPDDRYVTAAELADDLDSVLHFRPIAARPTPLPRRIGMWARRRPVHAVLIALLIVGVPTVTVLTERAVRHRRLVDELTIEELLGDLRLVSRRALNADVVETASAILAIDAGHVLALRARAVGHAELGRARPDRADEHERRALEDADAIIRLRPDAEWPRQFKVWVSERLGGTPADDATGTPSRARSPMDSTSTEELEFAGLLALDRGRWDEAEEIYTQLTVRKPDDPLVPSYRAQARERQGRIEEAIVDYRVALGLHPDDFLSHYNLGRLLTQSGRPEEGLAHFSHALKVEPDNAFLYEALADNALGLSHEAASDETALGHLEAAERHARRSLALRGDLPAAHLNLGVTLMEQNRLIPGGDPARTAEALTHYEAARDIWADSDPDAYLDVMVNLCDALIQTGRTERAIAACLAVTRDAPDNPDGFYNLAGAYAQAGRVDDAFSALDRDFELGDRDHDYLVGDAWFAALRDDPRFERLIERMKEDPGDE